MVIYDYLGRPVKQQTLRQELAAPSLAGIRSVWGEAVASGLTPARLARLLRDAGENDGRAYLTLAEEMEERDPHYRCELGKRKMAVSRMPLRVEAATDAKADVNLADAVREMLKRAGIRALIKDMMDAVGKGYSVCEIIWNRAAQWMPAQYIWRDPRFFVFDRVTGQEVRLLDEADQAEGIPLAPYKFIVHVPHLKSGLPLRGGIARVAAWSWMCKNYTIKDWMAFAEVFGIPLRLGKYQAGADRDDIAVLKAAVANLGTDAAAVIPESMVIDFIESKITGSSDLFQRMADWFDTQISRLILGQTATTQGTSGKLGNEEAQNEVRRDIRDDDAEQIAETLNRDLIRPFIDLNFGPQRNYPALVIEEKKTEDLSALAVALEKLVPLGLRVEASVIADKFGLPDPDPGAYCLGDQPPPAANSARAANRAHACAKCQAAGPDAADLLAERAMTEADGSDVIEAVYRLLAESGSLEEAAAKLIDLSAPNYARKAGEALARGMMQAELAGRAEVEDAGHGG